jgi:GR25 family glycosyltransferase involved in LPS biosynthesis
MVKDSVDFAIILEDDISLTKNFVKVVNDIVCEVRKRNISNCIISLEDSSLQFVKSSEMAPDKILYKKSKGRMAGAYLVDHSAAENMIHEIENNRCNVPIDWFHNLLASKNLVNIYWSKYNVARQGSLDGSLNSIIDHKPYGFLRIISFNLQYIYKRIVYKFR